MFKIIVCIMCVYVGVHVEAESIEELKSKYVKYIMECSQKFPITQDEIEMLKKKQMPASKAVKCIFHCAYEKAGILDDGGYLSVQKVYAISEQYLSDDAGRLMKAKQFADACRSVNNVDLSAQTDSECERAALIFQCSVDKASQFDFLI